MYDQLRRFINAKSLTDDDSLNEITSYFNLIKTQKNEILLEYDQICNHYYFINKGCIRIFSRSEDGSESSRYFAFENHFATALPSFINGEPAEEYLQTLEKSELLIIKKKDFYDLVKKFPVFSAIYIEKLELGFINAQKRIYGFQNFNALQKVQWIIKNQPELLLRVSNKLVATYLGISPYTLSRIKAKL